jgi:class 3 adenylate cyclase
MRPESRSPLEGRSELPTGTVTFLFTDIEGSTRLLQELGEGFRRMQDQHAEIVRKAIAEGDGIEVRTEGDSFFALAEKELGAERTARLWKQGQTLDRGAALALAREKLGAA